MSDYLSSLFNLKAKVAAITGAGGHLCSEMSRSLARADVAVAVLDLRETKAEAVRDEIKAFGGNAIGLAVDVTQRHEIERALEKCLNTFGSVDILINGAGINAPTPFFEIPLEEWHSILDSHITSTFLMCQVFGRYMVEKQWKTVQVSL